MVEDVTGQWQPISLSALMGYLKVPMVCPLLQWLSSLGANLLHISMIDIKKLLLISLKVRCGVIMPWGLCQKCAGHTMRAFNHEICVYQVLTSYNNHKGGRGNTVMKCTYLLEHVIVESGKILRSVVHMQLKFFRVCTSMWPAILTHVIVWTMSFIHMHINLWCQS